MVSARGRAERLIHTQREKEIAIRKRKKLIGCGGEKGEKSNLHVCFLIG